MPAAAAAKNTQSEIQSKKMSIVSNTPSEVETKKAKDIVTKLAAASDEDREAVAAELAAVVKANGVLSLKPVIEQLKKDIVSKKSAGARAGAVAAIVALTNENLEGQAEPYIVSFIANLLELQADKQTAIKDAAEAAAKNLASKVNPLACPLLVPYILEGLGNSCKWQTKMLALELLVDLTNVHPKEFFVAIPDVIPVVSDCMWDTKADVKKQATETMATICKLIENKDIEQRP
ncbi:hypothetical protein G6F42_021968 [Rhizopus arrhizus]|nr:hypothetical protein G6F42_021968 [Rhizopus arrhizus]